MEEANVFKGYYRIIFISFAVILIIAGLLAIWQFQSGFEYEVNNMEDQLKENTAQLETIIQVAKAGLYTIRTEAELYLENPDLLGDTPQTKYLSHNDKDNFYFLDSLPTLWQENLGNITGIGDYKKLSSTQFHHLKVSCRVGSLLKTSLENSPNSVLAYTSFDNNFVNLFPFIPSKDFHVNSAFFETFHKTYAEVYPSKNPQREIIWTEVYVDEAGNGLMVSAVIPLYESNKHVGIAGIDLTLDSLNTIIRQSQREQGEIFLVNEYQQLMAHPTLKTSDKKDIPTLSAALPSNLQEYTKKWDSLPESKLIYAENHLLMIKQVSGTPWKLVYAVKAWDIYFLILKNIGLSLIFVIFSIGGIMIVSTYYTRSRFIQPATALVRRLKNEYNNQPSLEEKLPKTWQPWFEVVKEIFSKNRELVKELEAYNQELEFKVQERTEEVMTQNEELLQNQEEISSQRDHIEIKNKELELFNEKLKGNENILKRSLTQLKENQEKIQEKNTILEQKDRLIGNSIRAALSIQSAMLPYPQRMQEILGNYFMIFKPRDVVSGDFYWLGKTGNKNILVVADCTGHGVPGALMSMIGSSILDKIVTLKQEYNPDKILESMHEEIFFALKQEETQNTNGMDMAVVCWEKTNDGYELSFAGAKRPLYFIEKGSHEVKVIKGSRRSLGGIQNKNTSFDVHNFSLKPESRIYLCTDGYEDQNNPIRKKIGEKSLLNAISEIQNESLATQKEELLDLLSKHQQESKQRDDILLMGFQL